MRYPSARVSPIHHRHSRANRRLRHIGDFAQASFDSAVQTIEATHRETTLTLWSGDQLHDATQQQLRTASLGQAGVDFLNNLRPSLLSSATNLANAESSYHLSLATTAASDAAANALTLATPAAQFEADAATVKLTWLQQMAPQFATFVNASAVAEANASRGSAIAERDFQSNAATEDFNDVTAVVPLMTSLANSSATNIDTLHNDLSDASQAHRLSGSTAGLAHGVGGSTANKQHRIERAGNRQTLETTIENADQYTGAGQMAFRTSEADVELTRGSSVLGTDKTWRYDLAATDKTESYETNKNCVPFFARHWSSKCSSLEKEPSLGVCVLGFLGTTRVCCL